MPEAAAGEHCAVVSRGSAGPRVVVTIICGKHHTIVVAECITAGVTRESGHTKPVVGLFRLHHERTALRVVPVVIDTRLEVKSKLVLAAVESQLTDQVVAEPVVQFSSVQFSNNIYVSRKSNNSGL